MHDGTFDLDGVGFEAIQTRRAPSSPDHFGVRKSVWMIERYQELAGEFGDAAVVELGIDQGASTAMLALLLEPRRLAAFDIARTPVEALDVLVRRRGLEEVVRTHWGVDQSDTNRLLSLIDADVGDGPLDLVIDDASHELAPTTASFQALFPRLRPGGLFVIEDWSSAHQQDRFFQEVLDRGGPDAERVRGQIAARVSEAGPPPAPLSHLVLQLVLVAARCPELVADVRLRAGWCEVWRGAAPVPQPFAVRDHLGDLGRQAVADGLEGRR